MVATENHVHVLVSVKEFFFSLVFNDVRISSSKIYQKFFNIACRSIFLEILDKKTNLPSQRNWLKETHNYNSGEVHSLGIQFTEITENYRKFLHIFGKLNAASVNFEKFS